MSALFTPIDLRGLTIANRAWMASMCQYSAKLDGVPHDWHFAHLAARAVGGAGLILTEATSVSAEGRISPHDLGLWNDAQVTAFARITSFLRKHGVTPGIQLSHAGRKAATKRPWDGDGPLAADDPNTWTPLGPSPVPFADGYQVPEELSVRAIARIVDEFAAATRRALAAGFEVIEVHGAHGYLVNQFLSPVANKRTDAYGGSFANRIRFAVEVVDAIRAEWPEHLPLFFRVSATDWTPEGWTVEDTVRLATVLNGHGVDLLDVSTGGNAAKVRVPVGPGYQVPFAARVREEAGIPVAAVGLITDAAQAEKILANGDADAILLGRELLREPYWPRKAEAELDGTTTVAPQYARAH